MKFLSAAFLLLLSFSAFAQKPCEFSVNVNDSLGEYRTTKEYLIYEKNFAGKSSYIFASIAVADGVPSLQIQFIEKSFDFIKSRCLDKNSKIYIQLEDGKIVTLLHIDRESCGSMVRDDRGFNNRITSGEFMFKKNDYEYLKSSPISFIRIKFTTEVADYIFRKEFKAELDGLYYEPANYFVNFFHCLTDKN